MGLVFLHSGKPEQANALYEYVLKKAKESVPVVERGIFGADMKVELLNNGPVTIWIDSQNRE